MVRFKKVAVLMGGVSSEREVSLRSGEAIAKGLEEAGCEVTRVILDNESVEGLIPGGTEAVYIALHGGYGENGKVQEDLNKLGIPYTGPGAKASAIAIDKVATKEALIAASIPTPEYQVVNSAGEECKLNFPVVVKPPCDGSSVGLTCPCAEDGWKEAILLSQTIDNRVLVEEYIPGREWTAAIVAGEALPIIEIRPNCGTYDYKSKYTSGMTVYEPLEDNELTMAAQEYAKRACDAIGARGISRVDFRVTDDNKLYVLEINTVPGFTATSLVPKAAAKAGMTFSETCVKILNLARVD